MGPSEPGTVSAFLKASGLGGKEMDPDRGLLGKRKGIYAG